MPLVASWPLVCQSTGWLYQPLWSAGRLRVVCTEAGAVLSYAKASDDAAADVFPALSVQAPLTVRLVPSGPVYVPLSQLAIPLSASRPELCQSTGWLYQPL